MIDEQKIIGGGQPSELTDKALDEGALKDVSGGAFKQADVVIPRICPACGYMKASAREICCPQCGATMVRA